MRLFCSCLNQSGARSLIVLTWSLITGTIEITKPAIARSTPTITISTATGRLTPLRMKNSTSGLRPTARNIATTSSISTDVIDRICWPSQIAMKRPTAPVKPM